MRRYRVEALVESPLVVRRERQSQRSEGVQFLSGTLLRGAFARAYLQQHGQADALFERLFLDEQTCRFGPLDPAERVFPLTAWTCKREGGFEPDGKHGIVDMLAELVRPRLGQVRSKPLRCRQCEHDLKAHSGFWYLKADGQPTEAKRRWRQTVNVHVGIDRTTHTAAEAIFFTLPALEPEPATDREQAVALTGWVEAQDEALQALQTLLEMEDCILRLGHARTRGYGRIRVTVHQQMPDSSADYDAWSRQMLAWVAPALPPKRYFLFSLSLPTGAILVDELLRYTLDPAGMVPWLPPLPPPEPALQTLQTPAKDSDGGRLWCVTAVARHERLRGWNAAHGLPRQDEWLVARGSVYVYLFEGDSSGRAALQHRLRQLEANGIGARRNEGFGRVVVCDDFHLRFAAQKETS